MARIINDAEEAVRIVNTIGGAGHADVSEWLPKAPPKELLRFIILMAHEQYWSKRAQAALQVRLEEESAKTADKMMEQTSRLVQHTEKLTTQTQEHLQHAKTLTRQTDILVSESKKLGRLTWALIWLTVVLATLTAGLLYIDWHREHDPIITNATTH